MIAGRMWRLLVFRLGILLVCLLAAVQVGNLRLAASVVAPGSWWALPTLQARDEYSAWLWRFSPSPIEHRYLISVLLTSLGTRMTSEQLAIMQRRVQTLALGPDRADFLARIAILRGDHETAFAQALAAGDIDVADTQIDNALATHNPQLALTRQRKIVRQLILEPTEREALAQAYWRLGALESTIPVLGNPQRALDAFRASTALTPFSGRALLAQGYAALRLADIDEAQHCFEQVIAFDPKAASGYVGLARVALRGHRRAEAQRDAAIAQRQAATQSDVRDLLRDLAARRPQ